LGPVKIGHSASPEPVEGPTDPDSLGQGQHPYYVYQDKRSAEPEAESTEAGPWDLSHSPACDYSNPAPEKCEAGIVKLSGSPGGSDGPPHYLYQDTEKRAVGPVKLPGSPGSNGTPPHYLYLDSEKRDTEEAPKSTPTATPYYGYPVNEKKEEARKSTPTATLYYGYPANEKHEEAPKSTPTATPCYGYYWFRNH
jgi:hypothetical protein